MKNYIVEKTNFKYCLLALREINSTLTVKLATYKINRTNLFSPGQHAVHNKTNLNILYSSSKTLPCIKLLFILVAALTFTIDIFILRKTVFNFFQPRDS